jgi:FkbM family methyltransferase
MARGLTRLLKRWRDNYYVSLLLASSAKPLRFISARTARGLEQKVRKNGVLIRLPNGKNMSIGRDAGIGIASTLFWHGLDGYEPETSRTLRFFFERASTFVDVGANCGLYSVLGALWNPSLEVVAFEPVPAIFEGLKKNVLLNGLQGRVRCENIALSSETGRTAFFLPKSEGGLDVESTGTLARESWQVRKGSARIEVETERFDGYATRHPIRADLIKIDVEDFEADVLEGMRHVIMRDRPFIVCEILPRLHRNERTRKIVEALNYQPYWITPSGYVKVSRFDFGRGNLTDFLLSPVTTSDVVLDKLDELWAFKKQAGGPEQIVL